MAKKKQPDFQKTKLRVGKTLPKGQNVTDTSFKTRKIITRDQLKTNPGVTSLKEILNYLGHSNASTKIETLRKLNNYILEEKDTLSLFFPDILKKVGGILLQDSPAVRESAINVLHTCLTQLSDVQVSCFLDNLTSYLKCMMTHYNNLIQKDSLKFLDKILSTHPNVICHSLDVLSTLLNLISSVVHEEKNPSRGRKRKLDERISSKMTSQEWRVDVLRRIYVFLQYAMAKEKVLEDEDEDECMIYWDAKKPLYLPLYLRGGITPIPWESLDSNSHLKSINSKEFEGFIYDLVPLLSEIIKGEISVVRKQKFETDTTVDLSVIKHLNIVVKIVCLLGEWLYHKPGFQVSEDEEFSKLLSNIICRQLLKWFPYFPRDNSRIRRLEEKGSECMQLNLGTCYLYCLFILGTEFSSCEMEEAIIKYLDREFQVSVSMCHRSISLVLKISKICIMSTNVIPSYKNGILLGLYGLLKLHNTLLVKPIYSFFMEVSLNYDFKYLLDSEGMKAWFNGIMQEIVSMKQSGDINEKFLKYIRQICARKYSNFISYLSKVKHEELLELLKYDNEAFQLTIIQLICSSNQSYDLHQDLAELLSNPSFSLKTARWTIHMLHLRFSNQDVAMREKFLFTKFLLNLGCDTLFLGDNSWESDEDGSNMLRTVLESCHYELHPSSRCERHLELTMICCDYLTTYIELEPCTKSTVLFIKSILGGNPKLPIHCVVALLRLRKAINPSLLDEDLVLLYSELIFSSLMYLSVMQLSYQKKEGYESYAIPELQESLELTRQDVPDIIDIININIYNFGENELYHALRMTLFLIHKKLLQFEDGQSFFNMLEKINNTCQMTGVLKSLWMNICQFFGF